MIDFTHYWATVTLAAALEGHPTVDWAAWAVLVALIAIVVAVAIAWVQRRQKTKDDGRLQAQRRMSEVHLVKALDHRLAWDPEYRDIRELLVAGAEITWKIINRGPYTAAELANLGIDDFAMRAGRLASHGVDSLRSDLQAVVDRTVALNRHVLPARFGTGEAALWDTDTATAACRIAIAQDRAARSLDDAINNVSRRLRSQWSGEPETK